MKPQHAPALVREGGPQTAPGAHQGPRFPKLERALKQPEIQAQVGWQALPLEVAAPDQKWRLWLAGVLDRKWRLWLAGVLALGLTAGVRLTSGLVEVPAIRLALPDLPRSSTAGVVVQALPALERPALVAQADAKVSLQSSLDAVVGRTERPVP